MKVKSSFDIIQDNPKKLASSSIHPTLMHASISAAMHIKNKPFFVLLVLFLSFSLKFASSYRDTITANQSLSGSEIIVSAGGVFRLSFFSLTGKYYICIGYSKIDDSTIVWVANRDKPIFDRSSSQLKILNGNLVLVDESQTPVWSTNLSSNNSNSVYAVLEDTGNLVLRDGSNSTQPLWQSFDEPTDTWLPGCKIGFDKRTKKNKHLTSWKNSEDPASGLFTLEHDPNGINQFILQWNRSETYWETGAWDGQAYSKTPELRSASSHGFNISYVSNENESYFVYYVSNPSIITRFVMAVSGQVNQLTWLDSANKWFLFWSRPGQQCMVTALCGAFGSCDEESSTFCSCLPGFEPKSQGNWNLSDHSAGCERKNPLQCGNTSEETDKFLAIPATRLPVHTQLVTIGSGKECKTTCLSNCSCTAYAYDSNGCSIWIGDILNLQQLAADDRSKGNTLYLRLAASEFPSSSKGMNICIVVGSVVGAVVLLGLVLFYIWRRKRLVGPAKAAEGSLMSFEYRYLQNATKNFTDKLGGGGFGSVFKGTLSDSTVIAVKKLESISQGEKQFRSEVSTIGAIQHVNLVRLRGFCSEGTKKLLVYDYMLNGSLNANLFHEKDSKVLDWKTRYQIALGTARGLVYLHDKCRDCIIHCDIKPENILLDSDFVPKVADFGMAKLVGRQFSRVLTTMRGTRGYLAPEWISGVAITAKADVYSYGMMLFEVVSGRRNTEQSEDGRVKFFPTIAAKIVIEEEADILSLLEPRLEGNADIEEVTRVCRIACWCIQDDETHRPSMSQVVQMLEGVLEVKLPPMPRSLQVLVGNQEHTVFFFDSEPSSVQISQARNSSGTGFSHAKSITSTMNSSS